jgi:hypothetical protein
VTGGLAPDGLDGSPHLPQGAGWTGALGAYHGLLVLVALALPIAVATTWMLAHRRRVDGMPRATAWGRSMAEAGIVLGTVPFVWLTMLPGDRAGAVTGAVSLVPLRDLATMSSTQVGGNLLGFAALGFLAPTRFAALASLPRVLALAAVGSGLIETLQHVLALDRVTSVDDVLLNTVGAGIAALASRPWWRRWGVPAAS